MRLLHSFFLSLLVSVNPLAQADARTGPIRVLFLGHESAHHNSNELYPMLSRALGPDAIYFDYVTSVEDALGDARYLDRFDVLLLYANHGRITAEQWKNLKGFVEGGGGFVPVHCASWCFGNEPGFDRLVGARFESHQTGVFKARVVSPSHPAMVGVEEFEAWDETYVHHRHNEQDREVLMVRDPMPGDPHGKPEPWTWVRNHGKGRVFYTASGHDARVWKHHGFHELMKAGILWAAGSKARAEWEGFIASRQKLSYEVRDDVPNYEKRPKPLPYQLPLPASESMKYTRVPAGFRLELFACEPDVVNPIYMQWDERGRLWVAESVDYPNEIKPRRRGSDCIKILEDTDGDGACDSVKVFAEGLNIPTSFVFARGGIIVAQAPDFLFFKDTDGDDRADVREVLFSGWGVNDTHAGPSNLRHGFDNWIWGTVGYARFRGELGDEAHDFGMGAFRFKADASAIEFRHQFNNNTWGLGFNEAGDVFGSTANNNPSFFGGIPAAAYGKSKGMSAKMIASSTKFHPITPNVRQVDAFGAYTAGCGHAFATSAAFPESYRGRVAFVCGPTGHLLGKFRIEPEGAGFVAKNAFAFLASVDEWFSPIVAEVGPDGHLWVADWYNFIIQHNPTPSPGRGGYQAQRGTGNAHVNPNRDRRHGRIYRVVWEASPDQKISSLAGASTEDLVAALGDENLFWRQTAQRLLVSNRTVSAVPALVATLAAGGKAAIHALWALEGLGALDAKSHHAALIASDPGLVRNAIRALGTDQDAVHLLYDSAVLAAADPQVRLAAFTKLASFPRASSHRRTSSLLLAQPENAGDDWLRLALGAAGAADLDIVGHELGPNLLANASFEEVAGGNPVGWTVRTYSAKGEEVEHTVEMRKNFVRTGSRSLRIRSVDGHDTSWFAPVELEAGKRYQLSAWIKTAGVRGAHGALLNVHELQHKAKTKPLQKKNDWTRVEVIFESTRQGLCSVNCLFGGWGQSTGTAWYDDIALQEWVPTYATSPSGLAKADVASGEKIFSEHAVAACVRCHAIGGTGGVIGPALDGIAVRKTRDYIMESLVKPMAQLAEGYDKFGASPMPPMDILLTKQELADVMAYLMTLKKPLDKR